jgi:hypothetical protein
VKESERESRSQDCSNQEWQLGRSKADRGKGELKRESGMERADYKQLQKQKGGACAYLLIPYAGSYFFFSFTRDAQIGTCIKCTIDMQAARPAPPLLTGRYQRWTKMKALDDSTQTWVKSLGAAQLRR